MDSDREAGSFAPAEMASAPVDGPHAWHIWAAQLHWRGGVSPKEMGRTHGHGRAVGRVRSCHSSCIKKKPKV